MPVFLDADVARLSLPADYTYPVPSTARGSDMWFLDLMGDGMAAWHVFVAIVPALMLLVLFFFDHNVSSILAQSPRYLLVNTSVMGLLSQFSCRFGLKKPAAFHW